MRAICLIVVGAILVLGIPAWAQETVSDVVVKGREEGIAIAVPPFATAPGLEALGQKMAALLRYDLDFTGLFTVLLPHQYPPDFVGFTSDAAQIDFDAWRATNAEFLVHCYLYQEDGAYLVDCRLFDLYAAQTVVGVRMKPEAGSLHLAGHQFSEEIVRALTGVPGVASSQLCFSGGPTGSKEIYVSDYDGVNLVQVTKHNSVSILPQFSPDGRKIAYVSFKDRFPFLYILDLDTGSSVPLSKSVGLNVAPAWAPDGKRLAIVLSKDANAEIYLVNRDGSNPRRLTDNRAMDTSPSFHPDGSRIAFVSERAGSAQIYAMNADGSGVTRLSYQGGRSYDPAWSPDGRSIAYVVERRGEGLEIYMMDADGKNPRRLTASPGSNESPSWSPDSRHVVFASTRTGTTALWTVNVASLEARRVPALDLPCQGPDWGPRRK
ncbi:MAG: Tol-Pal system beta propeller repeat protein TolB [Candidatus Hydrogenedentes bacterium]|nr:Tol-Pal system beta propeller repeat protein TolB [Candidatus Hydrogenedentota bacterium]